MRHQTSLSNIRSEGGLFPPDLLTRIAEGDPKLGGLTADSYGISKLRLSEHISAVWSRLKNQWRVFHRAVASGGASTTFTRERWLMPLLQELGYLNVSPVRLEIEGRRYPLSHMSENIPIHLLGFGISLERRTPGVIGAATTSPHNLVQTYLNQMPNGLWGIVSNGEQFRLIRRNASLTQQAYLEFDLAAIIEGEYYADFAVFWLICHSSHLLNNSAGSPWAERWVQFTQVEGVRAFDALRENVQQAIEFLGSGFLAHAANSELRVTLQSGSLTLTDYYYQVLRLVYRIIFLLTIEERELLHSPGTPKAAKERYEAYYSMARMRRLAGLRVFEKHADLYHATRVVLNALGRKGCEPLGLSCLGGLFEENLIFDRLNCQIANDAFLDAIRALTYIIRSGIRRAVDYKAIGAEELGSVYESLLDMQPEMNVKAGTFRLKSSVGNERKSTGSYYTPTALIDCLLDSTLDPIVADAIKKPEPAAALLNLNICDPACGSGHFLIAAMRRIALKLATIRSDGIPSPNAIRVAIREVGQKCVYGVDLNPMAVELCRVAIWIESFDPERPLMSLDKQIITGNSLLGAALTWGIQFDCVIGNPPWDHIRAKEHNYYAALRAYIRQSGVYLRSSVGTVNSAELFCEMAERLIVASGRIGLIIPTGLVTDSSHQHIFRHWIDSKRLLSLVDFENRERLFPAIDGRTKFSLLTLAGSDGATQNSHFAFYLHSVEELKDLNRAFTLSYSDLALFNPNTRTCPVFRTRNDLTIAQSVYRRFPVLGNPKRGNNVYPVTIRQMFGSGGEGHRHLGIKQLLDDDWSSTANHFTRNGDTAFPLYESKMINAYDHRSASIEVRLQNRFRSGQKAESTPAEHANPDYSPLPRYWIHEEELKKLEWTHSIRRWHLVFKEITSATNARTFIACIVPWVGIDSTLRILDFEQGYLATLTACVLGNINCFMMDYLARQKVGGNHMTAGHVWQLPFVSPECYTTEVVSFIAPRILELSYTANDLASFAHEFDYNDRPFQWDEERRFILRAELDALYFHLYRMTRKDVEYILDTFATVKRYDCESFGNYRTAEVILQRYDGL